MKVKSLAVGLFTVSWQMLAVELQLSVTYVVCTYLYENLMKWDNYNNFLVLLVEVSVTESVKC
jgi:hypothetical protein